MRAFYLPFDETEPAKLHFERLLGRYRATIASTPPADLNEIVMELENARGQLASTSGGLNFLIMMLDDIKSQAESTGPISDASEAALCACAGMTSDAARYFRALNLRLKEESAKAAERAQAGQPGETGQTEDVEPEKAGGDQGGGKTGTREPNKPESSTTMLRAMMLALIESITRPLSFRKRWLERIEKEQETNRFAAAVLPADSTFERFERAETAHNRRLYRSLGALHAMKHGTDASKILK